MSRHFRPWKIDQAQLLPPAIADCVPGDHLAQFVVALAREHLDLSEIVASYKSGLGQPPFDPRLMTALLLYAYCSGLYSSRRIAKACAERVDFMTIVAHDAPDFRTIADFRKRHLPALGRLFLQVLKLAEKAGLAKLGHVALDGTKIKANASKHKAMSYERMKTRETQKSLHDGDRAFSDMVGFWHRSSPGITKPSVGEGAKRPLSGASPRRRGAFSAEVI